MSGRPDWLTDELCDEILSVFRGRGVDAAVYLARETDPTEAVFVVGRVAMLPEETLVHDPTVLLGRKVQVTAPATATWKQQGLERLDARECMC